MADLVVTITESVTLNGTARGSSNALTITGVDDIYHRIITCPDDVPVTVATFHSTTGVSDSSLDVENVKYIRVTNLDASTSATLSLQSDVGEDDSVADESASLLIEAGKSFIMGSPNDGIGISDANANLVTDLVDLESLVIFTGGSAVDIEVFVASA